MPLRVVRLPPRACLACLSRYMLRIDVHRAMRAGSAYIVEDKRIPGPGGDLRIRCVTPTVKSGQEPTFPVVLNIHGGGES